ncbi:hypothetical protein BUALT_Bualt06G0129000 [Buddleja alternifolia]|uniref:Protein kinase domain-containing protein n=1 Tax=Buddleja alternifolia TaxID=168488 RepID=A0AAV6XLK3_9LAMI|nr:hypothetical protein BUALT_Bualt06G0129000 [Buddleja alternifolia]
MSRIYDNWERLVAAVLRKQQLWELFHEQSRSPSIRSEASSSNSSSFRDVDFEFPSPESSSTYWKQLEDAVANSHKLFPKLVWISDFSPAFDVEVVLLGSAKLLGSGTFGSAYTAAMGNGIRIVVKRLKSVSISEPEFKRHMDIVGNVRHENVAPLRAYYSFKDERLVLYDYYETNVYALLHGKTGLIRPRVDWETRLRIAIGAARGIDEIHTQNDGKLVHGNIKASNIFLNAEQYGCVSDLGLTNTIETIFTPTARCYAPEVKNTQNVSQASDVYSFGILLLELLTRKPSVHVPGGPEVVDLVKLVTSVKSKVRAAKAYDVDLLKHPTIKEQMVKMLKIGISCVAKSQKKRPKMSEIVKMLEDISLMNPVNRVPSKLVFVDDANPTFDLEGMLRASAEVLGKGTFGTSYKGTLENGNIIRVKRLKDVNVTLYSFQKHMEVIGRMRHINVADVRAYFFSKEEKILVYDYYNQDSVSALLHGKTGAGKIPLDLATRLKIAVGAARGIAHIHRQDGGKLVHGNIKSSNIFLDGQKYGIICDTGIGKVSSPVKLSSTRSPGYFSPEVTDTKKVTQASDVYSFGVILLELISGRPSQHTTDDGEVVSLVKWIESVIRDDWTSEVIDLELMTYQNIEESMLQLLQIGMDCVAIAPERRPRMSEVVKMLEEISGIEPSFESGLDDPLEDPPGGLSIGSRLEGLLEDLLPKLII